VPPRGSRLHAHLPPTGCNLIEEEGARALGLALGEPPPELVTGGIRTRRRFFPPLRQLRLNGNKLRKEGTWHIAYALRSNPSLQLLDLSANTVGDGGASALAKALQTNRSLRVLHLQDNGIGDDGVTTLCDALGKSTTLHSLNLQVRAPRSRYTPAHVCARAQGNLFVLAGRTGAASVAAALRRARNPAVKAAHFVLHHRADFAGCGLSKELVSGHVDLATDAEAVEHPASAAAAPDAERADRAQRKKLRELRWRRQSMMMLQSK